MTKQKAESMREIKKINRQLNEEMIRKTESSYDDAWHQCDIEGLLICFKEDALIISPRNDVASGKDQIRKLFSDFLAGDGKNTKHTSRISRINFVTSDVAVVDGEAFIDGAENLSATDMHHRFTDILVRSGEEWLISQIRAYTT
jgi:uncharacterized protein (TIGR02246 family)